jgi:hypothetical protein
VSNGGGITSRYWSIIARRGGGGTAELRRGIEGGINHWSVRHGAEVGGDAAPQAGRWWHLVGLREEEGRYPLGGPVGPHGPHRPAGPTGPKAKREFFQI